MLPTLAGLYCPGCGYDLRRLTSAHCPECGLKIDATRSGIIPWEHRKTLGHLSSFFQTFIKATFSPVQLARATGLPIDVRSARLFRWMVRLMVIVPMISLFIFIVSQILGSKALPSLGSPVSVTMDPFWEPAFLWVVGATLWPILPIGFVLFLILSTGVSHWLYMKTLEPARQNRAMALSFYLCAPLGWVALPCLFFAVAMVLANAEWVGSSSMIDSIQLVCCYIGGLLLILILCAIVNSLRAVHGATQCGFLRSAVVGTGVLLQAAVSCIIGLALFPAIAGLFRLMVASLWR